jgi:transposase
VNGSLVQSAGAAGCRRPLGLLTLGYDSLEWRHDRDSTERRRLGQDTGVLAFLRQESHAYRGQDDTSCRCFLAALKWMSRSGAQWRLLLAEYGAWNSVYKRFVRRCAAGVFERRLAALATDPDPAHGRIDATIVRAHPCAAGAQEDMARKRSGGAGAGTVARSTSPSISPLVA